VTVADAPTAGATSGRKAALGVLVACAALGVAVARVAPARTG
jgi:hypothetical protein